MALNVSTLGAGSARSGKTSPGRYTECSGCGFEATCDHKGRDGNTYPFCEDCLWRVKEVEEMDRQLEEEEEDGNLECADCGVDLGPHRAPLQFLHLTKGAFWVCSDCWVNADHEDDYLVHCNCNDRIYWKPEGEPMSCYWCCRPVKHVQHCDCPVPSIDKETSSDHCLFCKGAVENKKDE